MAMAHAVSVMESTPGSLRPFADAMRFTLPYNVAGLPTLTLRCGHTAQGMPLALQLVARPFEEELLLRAGHAYESATEWHRRHPTDPV